MDKRIPIDQFGSFADARLITGNRENGTGSIRYTAYMEAVSEMLARRKQERAAGVCTTDERSPDYDCRTCGAPGGRRNLRRARWGLYRPDQFRED